MLLITPAEGLVFLDFAIGVCTAGGSLTGVDTLAEATGALYHAGKSRTTVPVGGALIGAGAALHKGIPHQASRTKALEGAWHVGARGRGMADCYLLTLVDVLTAGRCADKAHGADTSALLADLSGPTVFLLVTARLAGAVQADLTLQTVAVRVADFHTHAALALFTPGTVGIDLALEVTHAALADMSKRTGASSGTA